MVTFRIVWGLTLLFAPKKVILSLGGIPLDPKWNKTVRILGIRHLLQSWFVVSHPGKNSLLLGVGIDSTHVLSGLFLAVLDKPRRRLALADTFLESTLLIWGYLDSKKRK